MMASSVIEIVVKARNRADLAKFIDAGHIYLLRSPLMPHPRKQQTISASEMTMMGSWKLLKQKPAHRVCLSGIRRIRP